MFASKQIGHCFLTENKQTFSVPKIIPKRFVSKDLIKFNNILFFDSCNYFLLFTL